MPIAQKIHEDFGKNDVEKITMIQGLELMLDKQHLNIPSIKKEYF